MPAMIAVRDLRKEFKVYLHHRGALGALRNLVSNQYRLVKAVDGINFSIEKGELVGYLGPNGAGKSTTIKMLAGLLVPSNGTVLVNGRVPWRERQAHVARIGAVFGQRNSLWWDLPVIESLDLLRHIYRVSPERYEQNLEEFCRVLDMQSFLYTPVRSLSLGQLMRANLAAALLHDPDILFLDEPTIGLDVVAKEHIRQFIQQVNRERGVTVILTTHDLADVAKLCQRVLMIDHGQLLYDGQLQELQRRFGGERELLVEFAEEYEDISVPEAELVEREGLRATYRFHGNSVSASALIGSLSARYHLADLSVREPEIEATVRRIYEERLLDTPQE